MKTRENELHEPIIEILQSMFHDSVLVRVTCPYCKKTISIEPFYKAQKIEEKIRKIVNYYIQDCPKCGKRLKEIKNEQ